MSLVLVLALAIAQSAPLLPAADPLAGTVVDAAGGPAAGVEVVLTRGWSPGEDGPRIGWALWTPNARPALEARTTALARGRTDDAGRFRITLPAEVVRAQEPWPLALWAYREGAGVVCRRLPWAIPAPTEPVRLVLGRPSAAAFRILGPEGAPEAGARVEVTVASRLSVPEDLSVRLAAVAGPDGVAVTSAFAPDEVGEVRVTSPRLGTQVVRVDASDAAGPATIRMEASGRVAVRVESDHGRPVVGLRLQARTFPEGVDLGGPVGSAEALTDGSGRFDVPAIAAGRLTLVLDFASRPDLPLRGQPPAERVVEAGGTTTVEVALKRAVRITGVVRERGTGVPITGVRPAIPDPARRRGGNPPVVTDAEGRFAGSMEGQQPYAFLSAIPRPYVVPSDAPETTHQLPAGATEFALPPIELARGVGLAGTVVDEDGRTVPGAVVRASWGGGESLFQTVATRTDSVGSFALEGVDPLADLQLSAEAEGRGASTVQTARAGAGVRVRLVVSQTNVVTLAGRVVDATGRPVEGVHVRIRSQIRAPGGQVWRVDPVRFADGEALRTDAQGRFRTPHGLSTRFEYSAAIRDRGRLPGRTPWLKPGGGRTASFADVTLRRLRAVEGVVRDRRGRPLPDAEVFQSGDGPIRTRTRSDERGRFRLPGVIEGPAIVFARKEGFRFLGQPIDTEGDVAELVLARTDEANPILATLPGVLPRTEELDLARRLLAPHVEKALREGTGGEIYLALLALVPIDPARVLERIEPQATGKPPVAPDSLRNAVATGLARESPEEAVSVVASMQDPEWRSWCLIEIVDRLPEAERSRKADLLAQAQLQARAVAAPDKRAWLLGSLADRWLDLSEGERARTLLREGRALIRDVPPPGLPVALFAPSLARVDLEDALAVIEAAKDLARRGDRVSRVHIFDRAYGEIAYRLADRDPAGAERALPLVVDPSRRDASTTAACARMACVDLPRARRLSATIGHPFLRAYALGLMARAQAAVDRRAAGGLLDEAFAALESHRDDDPGLPPYSPAEVAAVLLSSIERVDPGRLQESVWRAVALRAPRPDVGGKDVPGPALGPLAMNLARYDRTAASAVLAPALAAFDLAEGNEVWPGFVAMAEALVDPRRAVARVEAMPDDPGLDRNRPKNGARMLVAEILGAHGDARWRMARQWGIGMWRPEGSDL